MLKKKEVTSKHVVVNENLLNIITPSGIDFDKTHTSLGENFGKIYSIVRYPQAGEYGWLAPLCNLEGTSTYIEYRYTPPDRLIDIFNKRISEMRGIQDVIKYESERQANKRAIKDLEKMINQLRIQQEPVGYVNIMLHIQSTNEEMLNARIKRVSGVVALSSCNIKLQKYRQGIALKVMAPYGIPNEVVTNMGERNMPLKTFLGGFPMANPGLNDEGGFYLGKTTNKKLVILNQWKRSKDRTNSNWVILGVPGVGKSTALKTLLTKEFAFGRKIIMLDPEEEYVDLANHPDINGNVVDCVGGSRGRINPLQIRSAAKITEEDLEEGEDIEDFFSYGEADDSSDMALYIQQLRVFFTLYFGKEEMTAGIRAVLEECLIELYNDFNIFWDTDISKLENTDFPIMKNLYEKAEEKSKQPKLTTYKKENYEKFLDLLYSSGKGADRLWNGHTTIESEADWIDLVISKLLEVDDRVRRAQFSNIITWVWHVINRDRKEKVIFGIDEGYLVCDPDMIEVLKSIRNISKRIRKYEGSLMFITHSLVDMLAPEVKRLSQAIIDSACYKFIMGCDGQNLEDTTNLFNLTEREVTILKQKNRGQGIFFAGNMRLDLQVDVADEFLEMFGEAGGR